MKQWLTKLSQQRKFIFFIALSWTILIFIGCSLPGKDIPKLGLFDHFDKLVHFTFFFVFIMLWQFYFTKNIRATIYLLIVAIIYGFALEFYQLHFVAGRSFDVWDAVADTIGAAVACLCWRRK